MTFYNYNGKISVKCNPVVIANGATTSAALELEGHALVGIEMPSAFTGTTITFTGSLDNTTFVALYNSDGTQLSVPVSTSRMILFCPGDFVGPKWIKVVSGSTEGAARTLCLVTRGFV